MFGPEISWMLALGSVSLWKCSKMEITVGGIYERTHEEVAIIDSIQHTRNTTMYHFEYLV